MRDGANLVIDGYDFAPTFSIWTTIEECLNPPVIWEQDRGWYTTAPFSEPEVFEFPGGIGPVECVNVEHEEVLLVPRWVDCRRVTFKYGLGDEFIAVLEALHKTGLDRTDTIRVRDVEVSPRDVVAAALPNPAELGDRMHGKTCAGTWVTGTGVDGTPREVYLHHVVDNDWSMAEYGHQAVVWQTAINPVDRARARSPRGTWSGQRRARPRGVRRGALPRPAHRVRLAVGHGGAHPLLTAAARRPGREHLVEERVGELHGALLGQLGDHPARPAAAPPDGEQHLDAEDHEHATTTAATRSFVASLRGAGRDSSGSGTVGQVASSSKPSWRR